ncbi:hypothetical protein ACFQ2B_30870 [Streptomyces stramineus]
MLFVDHAERDDEEETTRIATICVCCSVVPKRPKTALSTTSAPTARAPTQAVRRGPPIAAVTAGAATSSGPRWMSAPVIRSTTVITAMSPSGTAISPGR